MVLRPSEKLSVLYHDIFDYPLKKEELKVWNCKKGTKSKIKVEEKNGFYFVKGREKIIEKRSRREKYSKNKLEIAKKASKLISKIPTVLFVGITGALAMNNASKDSDIDLFIITKKQKLWSTRFLVYGLLKVFGYKLRKPGVKNEKDKLCLNMWLDETSLAWEKKDRNIYTAHEMVQIKSLLNKQKTFEKLLQFNNWITNYWPNTIKIIKPTRIKRGDSKIGFFEKMAYKIQYLYMRNKITREKVSINSAVFHPNDWGKRVINKLY